MGAELHWTGRRSSAPCLIADQGPLLAVKDTKRQNTEYGENGFFSFVQTDTHESSCESESEEGSESEKGSVSLEKCKSKKCETNHVLLCFSEIKVETEVCEIPVKHVVYIVKVFDRGVQWEIKKTFGEFVKLNSQLIREFGEDDLPEFPEKWIDVKGKSISQQRRETFENYLKEITKNGYGESDTVKNFLRIPQLLLEDKNCTNVHSSLWSSFKQIFA
eukprot:Nk52_evm35s208 gene=Nk52_evmTU35s208